MSAEYKTLRGEDPLDILREEMEEIAERACKRFMSPIVSPVVKPDAIPFPELCADIWKAIRGDAELNELKTLRDKISKVLVYLNGLSIPSTVGRIGVFIAFLKSYHEKSRDDDGNATTMAHHVYALAYDAVLGIFKQNFSCIPHEDIIASLVDIIQNTDISTTQVIVSLVSEHLGIKFTTAEVTRMMDALTEDSDIEFWVFLSHRLLCTYKSDYEKHAKEIIEKYPPNENAKEKKETHIKKLMSFADLFDKIA